MPQLDPPAGELLGHDDQLIVPAAAFGALVADVLTGLVEDLQRFRRQCGKLLPYPRGDGHLGKPFRNGFTVTLAKTPEVT